MSATLEGAGHLFDSPGASLLPQRGTAEESSCSTSINQNPNTLMQELDCFDKMWIVSTILSVNYDPALLGGAPATSSSGFRMPPCAKSCLLSTYPMWDWRGSMTWSSWAFVKAVGIVCLVDSMPTFFFWGVYAQTTARLVSKGVQSKKAVPGERSRNCCAFIDGVYLKIL